MIEKMKKKKLTKKTNDSYVNLLGKRIKKKKGLYF